MRARNVSHYTIPDVGVVDDDARKQVLRRQGTQPETCQCPSTNAAVVDEDISKYKSRREMLATTPYRIVIGC
ncbi:hypothetical protein CEP53_005065 [Fusarium sp. AF-6]|nr:hypothetical protein CEP53_005065 [Fusarium sp. AF-6]